jgi:hypothetical protein
VRHFQPERGNAALVESIQPGLFVSGVHMSAKVPSRDFALGQVKKLQRMKQPLAVQFQLAVAPRNHVARAAALRASSGAAGRHVRSQGAQRRAEKVALARIVRELPRGKEQD